MGRFNRFTSKAEAELACGLLRSHGIDAYVSVDDAGGNRPDFAFSIGGTVVVVPDDDHEQAQALLDDAQGHQ